MSFVWAKNFIILLSRYDFYKITLNCWRKMLFYKTIAINLFVEPTRSKPPKNEYKEESINQKEQTLSGLVWFDAKTNLIKLNQTHFTISYF